MAVSVDAIDSGVRRKAVEPCFPAISALPRVRALMGVQGVDESELDRGLQSGSIRSLPKGLAGPRYSPS